MCEKNLIKNNKSINISFARRFKIAVFKNSFKHF